MFGFENARFKETLWLNLLRGAAAGVVWMIVFLIKSPPDMSKAMLLTFPIGLAIGMVTIMPTISWIFKVMGSMGIPFMGLGNVVIGLLAVPGDPILYMLHKIKPELVPVQDYRFITWTPFIVVTDEFVPQMAMEETAKTPSIGSCPFKGRILAEKDTTVLGFNWTAKQTMLEIHDDWKVTSPKDFSFGWIDINGGIHKGQPLGEIDQKATLSSAVVAKIVGSGFYVGNNKIGEFVNW
jgi:hypothetical protein